MISASQQICFTGLQGKYIERNLMTKFYLNNNFIKTCRNAVWLTESVNQIPPL